MNRGVCPSYILLLNNSILIFDINFFLSFQAKLIYCIRSFSIVDLLVIDIIE